MGANRKQGWCLFVFLVGFIFFPAGLVYLGPIFALIGLAFLIGSAIGFYRIKPLEHGEHVADGEAVRDARGSVMAKVKSA